jgi:hypothetical protein
MKRGWRFTLWQLLLCLSFVSITLCWFVGEWATIAQRRDIKQRLSKMGGSFAEYGYYHGQYSPSKPPIWRLPRLWFDRAIYSIRVPLRHADQKTRVAKLFPEALDVTLETTTLALGGPYDGRKLDCIDKLGTSTFSKGGISFRLFPPLENWDDVASGRMNVDGPFKSERPRYWIEIDRMTGNETLHSDDHGRALALATVWHNSGKHMARSDEIHNGIARIQSTQNADSSQ